MSLLLCYSSGMKKKEFSFPSDFRLETWVVGVDHYVPNIYKGDKVHLNREPRNYYDANALAVINGTKGKCGYLPRYDARYLAPLIDCGAVEIMLEPTGERHCERVSVVLHVKLKEKGVFVFSDIDDNGMRAVYHRTVVGAWRCIDSMSNGEIGRFRSYFRDLVHKDEVSYETQFLYRMMKGVPEQRRIEMERVRDDEQRRLEREEQARFAVLRDEMNLAAGRVEVMDVIDCGRVVVLPIACSGARIKMVHGLDAVESGQLTFRYDESGGMLTVFNRGELPVICPLQMAVSDGFELFQLSKPAVVPPGGEVALETETESGLILTSFDDKVRDSDMPCIEERNPDVQKTGSEDGWIRLSLAESESLVSRLRGCRGVAVFVDGMFDSLELYSHPQALLGSFRRERVFKAQDGLGRLSAAQMTDVAVRLICESRVTGEGMACGGTAEKMVSLAYADAVGDALLGRKCCCYLGFFRWGDRF